VRISNKRLDHRRVSLSVEGLPDGRLSVPTASIELAEGAFHLHLGPDRTEEFRILLTASPDASRPASTDITFVVRDQQAGASTIAVHDHFIVRG
jgi:hypothetical protein